MNNLFGTLNMVDAALEAGREHFVFISTDKAVRPTSLMGATKRVAELIVQHAASKHDRNFVSVRFGNVLEGVAVLCPHPRRGDRSQSSPGNATLLHDHS